MIWEDISPSEFRSHSGKIRVLWTGVLNGSFRRCKIDKIEQWRTEFERSFVPRYKIGDWNDPNAEILMLYEYCNEKEMLLNDGIPNFRLNDDIKIIIVRHPEASLKLIVDGLHHAAKIQTNIEILDPFPNVNVIEYSSNDIRSIFYADYPHVLKRSMSRKH